MLKIPSNSIVAATVTLAAAIQVVVVVDIRGAVGAMGTEVIKNSNAPLSLSSFFLLQTMNFETLNQNQGTTKSPIYIRTQFFVFLLFICHHYYSLVRLSTLRY
jgi:hypothetical protein